MKYIGAHVSASGGVENAPENAYNIGATGFALFTKNQRQWKAKPLSEDSIAAFKENCKRYGYAPEAILPHDSYLINLGNPTPEGIEKSRQSFIHEMSRCMQLGLTMLNFHPGAHLKKISESQCIERIAESINIALDATEGVCAVIESTAGQGSNIGYDLNHLAEIISRVEDTSRVGVCIDTCHSFVAGYNLSEKNAYEQFWADFDSKIGLCYLKGLHLNDAKKPCGSRVDRHEQLGQGEIGMDCFKWLMQDARLEGIPCILETPEPLQWPEEIRQLQDFAKNSV